MKEASIPQTITEIASTMHAIECNNCKRVLYECDIQEGAIYETPLHYDSISECPECEHRLEGNYSRLE
jgi:hypothetical protein